MENRKQKFSYQELNTKKSVIDRKGDSVPWLDEGSHRSGGDMLC